VCFQAVFGIILNMETPLQNLPDDPILLRKIIASLYSEKQSLESEKQSLESKKNHFEQQARHLQEQLNILIAKRFGRSSEKHDPRQLELGLFDEAELIESKDDTPPDSPGQTTKVAAHERKKKGRKPFPDWLPRIEVLHDLPESEKVCGIDGSRLQEIGREKSEQLDFIPAKIQVLEHVRIKYGCPHCRKGVKTAPAPVRPFPKAMATARMMAYVAVSKYADGLPLYRQSGMMTRFGIGIPRSTMSGWMIREGQEVQPVINLLQDKLLDHGVVQMDETPVQVLKEPKKVATSKSYMWVRKGGPPEAPVVLFDYDPTRSGTVPGQLLPDYKGYLQTDGYVGYLAVGSLDNIIHVGCWAHARRKFDEVFKALGKGAKGKGKTGLSGQALAMIGKLYRIEKGLRKQKADTQTRYEVRMARAGPILDELKIWLDQNLPIVPPKSTLGKALGYLSNEWNKLIRYLEDGRLEIDNNRIENAIRPFVIGRKGWLFSDSVRGVKSSANLYSIIETAKANGLEPYAYLTHLFAKLPVSHTADEYEKLLPWNIDPEELSTP
jgi:transposase